MIAYVIWDIGPNIFEGFEYLRWYSLSWIAGIVGGYQVMRIIYKAEDISVEALDTLATYIIFGAIIGARLGHVLFYDPSYYLSNPIEILPFKIHPTFQFTGFTGLASHGGILGALIALYLYHRKYKTDYVWMLDRLVIGGALLGAFIRIGNLLNSEILGIPTSLPWAFVFTRVDQTPRHPTPLYEACFYLAIAVVLFFVWRSQQFEKHRGFLFGLGIFLIFSQRFLVEFLKENQMSFEAHLVLNMGQLLSIPLILAGLLIMIWSLRKGQSGSTFAS